MKRGNKKFESVAVFLIVFFQIFLMTNFCVAQSQQIYKTTFEGKSIQIHKNFPEKLKSFLIGFFSIKQIGFVEAALADTYFEQIYTGEYKAYYNQMFAQTSGQVCCEKMNNGAICQNVPIGYTECETTLFPSSCENFPSCRPSCCYDEEEGMCYPNTPKGICEDAGGISSDDANCNNELCQQGCCILGEETAYTTEKRCQFLSYQKGYDFSNFEKGKNPAECLEKQKNQKEGACTTSSGTCIFGTEANCYRLDGKFYLNKLCSNPDFENSQCEKQTTISCVNGKDEIYWFDSCGNRENIYSSDKDSSWNNGLVLNKEQSCGAGSSNINSKTCGNCDYSLGSVCSNSTKEKIEEGNFVCRSMNCVDEQGKTRINGESWCVYDGVIGTGDDLVGSRHWKMICQDGEVIVDPCADYRQEVCAESKKTNSEGIEMSFATCRINRWKNCISINSLDETDLKGQTKGDACLADSDCFWKLVVVGDSEFNYCLPQYPPGFDFWNKEGDAKSICAVASQNCTYVEDCDGCVANCDCIKEVHTQRMNDFCVSLGDCGGYFNYLGQAELEEAIANGERDYTTVTYTDGGYTIKNAPKVVNGLGCKGVHWAETVREKIKNSNYFPKLGSVIDYGYTAWENRNGSNVKGSGKEKSFWYAAFGKESLIAMHLFGTIALSSYGLRGLLLSPLGIDPITIGIISGILGKCDVDKTKVVFTCLPWTAPTKNQTCESCNDDSLKPCSEYRCKSLGAACQILNAGTENPVCFEENPGDVVAPKISFGEIGEEFKATTSQNGVEITLANGDCIPEFTPVSFKINTDEYATCKVKMNERSQNYEEMEEYFGLDNYYNKEHTGYYSMVNVDYLTGLLNNREQRNELIEKIRNFDLYVRCADNHGNYNLDEYVIRFCVKNGPDLTPPVIVASNPGNNSYIKYGEREKDLSIYLIEPSECKYSSTPGKNYFEMENSFQCVTDVEEYTNYGWECKTKIGILEEEETNIYIKCLDQPWLELSEYSYLLAEGRERNANQEDQILTFKKSKSNLSVSDVSPLGYIENGYEPVTISLSAKTSGGASGNGYATCRYIFEDKGWNAEFLESGTESHKQNEFNLLAGEYNMKVECKDIAGNIGTGETKFEIVLDTNAPIITNILKRGNNLEITTEENARCSFSHDSCMFDLENGTLMESSLSKTHQTNWKPGYTYYIKCKDIWENKNNVCDKVIYPDYF